MGHYLRQEYLVIHTLRRSPWGGLPHAVLSLSLACAPLETYLYSQQLTNMTLLQSGRCLLQALSMGLAVFLVPVTY